MVKKKEIRKEATRVAKELLEFAVYNARDSPELSRQLAELARRVMLKFNIRFDYGLRRFYCHGCKRLLIPGKNARVRLGSGGAKVVRITCTDCGYVNRKLFQRKAGLNT